MSDLGKALIAGGAVVLAAIFTMLGAVLASRQTARPQEGISAAQLQQAVNSTVAIVLAQREKDEAKLRVELETFRFDLADATKALGGAREEIVGLRSDLALLIGYLREKGFVDYPEPKHYGALTVIEGTKL